VIVSTVGMAWGLKVIIDSITKDEDKD